MDKFIYLLDFITRYHSEIYMNTVRKWKKNYQSVIIYEDIVNYVVWFSKEQRQNRVQNFTKHSCLQVRVCGGNYKFIALDSENTIFICSEIATSAPVYQ